MDFATARKRLVVAERASIPSGSEARLARAHEWQRQLDAGEVVSRAAIARREQISRARVTQILASLDGGVLRRARST